MVKENKKSAAFCLRRTSRGVTKTQKSSASLRAALILIYSASLQKSWLLTLAL